MPLPARVLILLLVLCVCCQFLSADSLLLSGCCRRGPVLLQCILYTQHAVPWFLILPRTTTYPVRGGLLGGIVFYLFRCLPSLLVLSSLQPLRVQTPY